MQIIITASDLMAGQLVSKGWFRAKCVKFETKPSAAGDSTNFVPHLQISEGAFMGKLLKKYYNTKAPGNLVELMKATGEEIGPGAKFDSDVIAAKMEGSDYWIQVSQGTYEGRLTNNIESILAGKEEVPLG